MLLQNCYPLKAVIVITIQINYTSHRDFYVIRIYCSVSILQFSRQDQNLYVREEASFGIWLVQIERFP
jgi:hypothetical protein